MKSQAEYAVNDTGCHHAAVGSRDQARDIVSGLAAKRQGGVVRVFAMVVSFLLIVLSTFSVARAADFDGSDFRVTYNAENLGVGGGVNDSYNMVTISSKAADVKTLHVTFDLPDGVSYVPGTVEMMDNNGSGNASGEYTISEKNISESNRPVFEILNTNSDNPWNANDYVTIRFQRTAECPAITYSQNGGVFKDAASLSYSKNGSMVEEADTDPNTGNYSLTYASLSLNDIEVLSGNVGETFSREITIINSGNAGTAHMTHEVWPGSGVIEYKLLYNGAELPPDASSTPDHLIYTIDMTTAPFSAGNSGYEDGDGNFGDGETLVFTETFSITACGNAAAVAHQVSWACQATERKSGGVLVDAGRPRLKITVDEQSHNICGVNHFKITVTNTGTKAKDLARDVLLNLGLGVNKQRLDIDYDDNNRWAFDCRGVKRVSNFTINGQGVTMDHWAAKYPGKETCGSGWTYAILPDTHDTDIDGSGGLEDLDHDGYYDDLAPGATLTLEFDYEMNPRENCGTGRFDYLNWEHIYFNVLNKNQCGGRRVQGVDLEYKNVIRDYLYPTLLEAATDVVDGDDFEVSLAPSMYSNVRLNGHALLDDSEDSQLTITITVPDGVDLASSADPAEFTQNGNEITWTTTDLHNYYLLGSNSFFDRFLNVPLQLNCSEYTASNGNDPLVIHYKTHLTIDDPNGGTCLERDIHCGSFPPIVTHCPVSPCAGPSIRKFDAHRITAGWTDSSMTERVDLSDTHSDTYNVDYYLAGDEMQIDVEGVMGNLTADNLHFVFTYTTDGHTLGAEDLEWVSGTLHYYDASTGSDTATVNLGQPTVTSSGNAHTVDFDLPLDALQGFVTQGDRFYLELHYRFARKLLDTTLHHLDEFRGHFYVNSGGQELSCDSWGDNAYYTYVFVRSANSIEDSPPLTSCEEARVRVLTVVYSSTGDIHPNEFRPTYRWNYTQVQLPEEVEVLGVEYIDIGGTYTVANGDVHMTDQGGNIYRIEPVAGKIPLVDHSANTYPAVYFTLKGSCRAADADLLIKVPENSFSQFMYLPDLPDSEKEVLGAREKKLTYTPPTYTMQPATSATLAGNAPYADFDVRLQNTSSNDVPYNWIYMPGISGIDVAAVQDITDPANPVDLTFHKDTDGSVWVEMDAIDAGDTRIVRFHAAYTICAETPVDFYMGFDCVAYPKNFTEAAESRTCSGVATRITLQPSQAQIQLKISEQPGTAVENCEPFEVTFEVNAAKPGTVVDPKMQVVIPGGVDSLIFDSITIEYPRGSGHTETVQSTQIDSATIEIPIQHADLIPYGGLPGTGVVGADVNKRKAVITMRVSTTCDFPSNSALSYRIFGNRTCGEPADGNGTRVNGASLVIAGLEARYDALSTITFTDGIVDCSDELVTVDTIIQDIPGDNVVGQTGDKDYSRVSLPAGMTYVAGSFQSMGNHAVTLLASADDYLLVKYPAGLQDNDTTRFIFLVKAVQDTACSQRLAVSLENYVEAISTCGTETCSSARLTTGMASGDVDLIKPELICGGGNQARVLQTTDNGTYTVNISVQNGSQVEFPAGNRYVLYCADAAGQPTGDSLYSGATSAIGANESVDIQAHFSSGTICDPATGMVVVWNEQDNCLCNAVICSIPLTLLVDPDSDHDGVSDSLDDDDDNDGIPDTDETLTGMDPDTDTDGDGVPDYRDPDTPGFTDTNGDGVDDRYDADGDGMPDHLDLDSDNDGLPDAVETGDADTDGDGIPDRLDLDSDNDGIADVVEAGGLDSDGDGVIDNFIDTDGDGLADAVDNINSGGSNEVSDGTPLPNPDTDGDGLHDFQDVDSDNDGISDLVEGGTDPALDADNDGTIDNLTDTDNDGLVDAVDPDNGGTAATTPDTDGDGVDDYRDLDSDNDGLDDVEEAGGEDKNGDGMVDTPGDLVDPGFGSDPYTPNNDQLSGSLDSDGDGMVDDITDRDGDGIPDVTDGLPAKFGDKNSFSWALFLPAILGRPIPDYCYIVADIDNQGSNDAPLFKYTFSDNKYVLVNRLGAPNVEAIVLSLDGQVLYGADNGVLGIIDMKAGIGNSFTPIDSAARDAGIGRGAVGSVHINDIDGLAFDPTDGTLYGTNRVGEGSDGQLDLLVKLNPKTGRIKRNGFGAGIDYVVIDSASIGADDVDDIAIDASGHMIAVAGNSSGGGNDHLISVNKKTGAVQDIAPLVQSGNGRKVIQDMEGLTLFRNSILFGTTGVAFGGANANMLYRIDRNTGISEPVIPLDQHFGGYVAGDFEAITCYPQL